MFAQDATAKLRPTIADTSGSCDESMMKAKVFLLPCIFGDEPSFANFRAALAERVDFELLDYPDVDRSSGEIRDFHGILNGTVERIRALQPTGDVHIAGYSFGGLVGFAAACRLQAEGRTVSLLALLDSPALGPKAPTSSGNRDAAPGIVGAMADIASRALIAAGFSESVRRAIDPIGRVFGANAAHGLRRLFLQNLRGRSLKGVSLGRFDGPLLLFRAEEQPGPDVPPDLGWSAHCRTVRSVTLDGDHKSMLGTNHLAANAERIWSELAPRIGQPKR
jgi:thioesterase domain-containing protein